MPDKQTGSEAPAWVTNPVAAFVHQANENSTRFFITQPNNSALLGRVNEAFLSARGLLGNSLELLPNLLLFRAHSLFLASIRLITSGQVYESYALLRACLEAGLYGFHVFKQPADAEVWLRRNDSEESRAGMKAAFRISNLWEELNQADPSLRETVFELYNTAIEFGGHPNPAGILSMAEWTHDERGITYEGVYITNDPVRIGPSMILAHQVAIATLRLFRHVHRERFDIMGLSEELERLLPSPAKEQRRP